MVEALLDSLPTMFTGNMVQESAMGPALQAAFLVTNHVGGKMLLFQSGVPSLGAGKVSCLLLHVAACTPSRAHCCRCHLSSARQTSVTR